jgi:hypothetical protein
VIHFRQKKIAEPNLVSGRHLRVEHEGGTCRRKKHEGPDCYRRKDRCTGHDIVDLPGQMIA